MKVVGLITLSLVSMVAAQCPKDKWYDGKLGATTEVVGQFYQAGELADDKVTTATTEVWFCDTATPNVCAEVTAGEAGCKTKKLHAIAKSGTTGTIDSKNKDWLALTEQDKLILGEAKKFTCAGGDAKKFSGHFTLGVINSLVKGQSITLAKTMVTDCKFSADGTTDPVACAVAGVKEAAVKEFDDDKATFSLGSELKGCAYGSGGPSGSGGPFSCPCGWAWVIIYVCVGLLIVGGVVAVVILSGDAEDDDDDDDEEDDDKEDDE